MVTAPLPGPDVDPLAAKLSRIAGGIGRVGKTSKHPQGWSFAPVEAFADAVRRGLAAEGIAIVPHKLRHDMAEGGKTRSGATTWIHQIRMKWLITDGKESLVVPMDGVAFDSSDKGFNKALTACRKCMMIAVFQLSSGDDPDEHAPEVVTTAAPEWKRRALSLLAACGDEDAFKGRMTAEGITSEALADAATYARARAIAQEIATTPTADTQPATDAEPPAHQDPPAPSDAHLISPAQRTRLHVIKNGAGWSDDAYRALLRDLAGVDTSLTLTRDDYDAVCEALEAGPGDPDPQTRMEEA